MDSWLTALIFALIVAISNWVQRKTQARESAEGGGDATPSRGSRSPASDPATSRQSPPRAAPGVDWQNELRRLLEGDVHPVPLPPLIKQQPQGHAAPPLVSAPISASPRPAPATRPPEAELESGRMTEAIAAYKRAQRLQEEASARLQHVVEQTRRHSLKVAKAGRTVVSPEIASAISLVRDRASVRQAVVASVILGPPRGLES